MNPLNLVRNSLCVVAIGIFLLTPFGNNEDMVNGLTAGKIYWCTMTIFPMVGLFLYKQVRDRYSCFTFSIPDLMVALFIMVLLLTYDWKLNPNATVFIFTLQMLIAWFPLRDAICKEPVLISYAVLIFLFTGIVQALWGIMQVYELADSTHPLFSTTGFFPNPGPYSGYLAFVLPVAVGYMLHVRENKNSINFDYSVVYYISAVTILLIVAVLPVGMSRSAWLAAFFSTAWVLWKYRVGRRKYRIFLKRKPRRVLLYTLLVVIVAGGLMAGLYHLKKESADGRMLIWKITTHAFLDNPVRGTGVGGFAGAYAGAQANYFAGGNATEHEKWVAGTPEAAFNEYLQILVETGIFGFLVFVVGIASIIYMGIRRKRYYAVGDLISLFIFSLTSYPLRDPSFLPGFLVLSVIAVGNNRSYESRHPRLQSYLIMLITVVLLALSGYQAYRMDNYRKWMETKALYNNKIYEVAAGKYYAPLYTGLHFEPAYLFEYAQCLGESGNPTQAIRLLQRAEGLSSDPMIRCMIGKNNMRSGRYDEAETYYRKALHLLPQRIYPYYLMTELYSHPGYYRPEKLRMTVDSVLYKRPKVENSAIREMREKVNKIVIYPVPEQNGEN